MSNEKIRCKEQQTNKREREKESGGNILGAQKGTGLCDCEALQLTAMQRFSLEPCTFSGAPRMCASFGHMYVVRYYSQPFIHLINLPPDHKHPEL